MKDKLELKPCPFCGGKMRLLGKDPLKIGIVMDCTECYIRVAIPWAYDAEHGIPAFNKRASGWIPCSERLPGHGEEVLICTTDGSMTTAEYDNGDWWLVSGGCLEDSSVVTHWMPLPEPPDVNGGCNEDHTDDEKEKNAMDTYNIIKDCTELRQLIAENPELPIVVMCESEAVVDDYSYTYMSNVRASIEEILDYDTPYADYVFDDRQDFKERISDALCDDEDFAYLSDEEFDKAVAKKAEAYDPYWKKAIVICAGN